MKDQIWVLLTLMFLGKKQSIELLDYQVIKADEDLRQDLF